MPSNNFRKISDLPRDINLDDYLISGVYLLYGGGDTFKEGAVIIIDSVLKYVLQDVIDLSNMRRKWRLRKSSGTWSEWKSI